MSRDKALLFKFPIASNLVISDGVKSFKDLENMKDQEKFVKDTLPLVKKWKLNKLDYEESKNKEIFK